MIIRFMTIFKTIQELQTLDPPQPLLLGADLDSIFIRFEIVEWGWLLLNSLKADEDPEVIQETTNSKPIIRLTDQYLFPKDAVIAEESYGQWVRSTTYILISEIENIKQACARILIRQIVGEEDEQNGKRRADGWIKLGNILEKKVFKFENRDHHQVKWWKEQSDRISNDKTGLGELRSLRGILHHGASDRGLSYIFPKIKVKKADADGRDEYALPIQYCDEKLTDLEDFIRKYVGWVQEHGFIPTLTP